MVGPTSTASTSRGLTGDGEESGTSQPPDRTQVLVWGHLGNPYSHQAGASHLRKTSCQLVLSLPQPGRTAMAAASSGSLPLPALHHLDMALPLEMTTKHCAQSYG